MLNISSITNLFDPAKNKSLFHFSMISFILFLLLITFSFWTASSVWSFPLFLIAITIIVYLPGNFLINSCNFNLFPIENFTLSCILGFTTTTLIYFFLALISLERLFALWPLIVSAIFIFNKFKKPKSSIPPPKSKDLSPLFFLCLIFLVGAGILSFAILPMYFKNFALLPNGNMRIIEWKSSDVFFHLSIAHELTHTIPPQAPFFSGNLLNYHYFTDLLAALLNKTIGIDIHDLTVRFLPSFFMMISMLSVFCFSNIWLSSPYAALLSSFLIFFGEDFSFIWGTIFNSQSMWSVVFFQVPTTLAFFFLNPMLPAIGILFSGLFCLVKYNSEKDKKVSWLILMIFFFTILLKYKIFAAIHVFIALSITGLFYLIRYRNTNIIKLASSIAVFVIPLVLYSWIANKEGGANQIVTFGILPSTIFPAQLLSQKLTLPAATFLSGGDLSVQGLISFIFFVIPIYLIGCFGLRILAFPIIWKNIYQPIPKNELHFFFSVFIIIGPIILLSSSITPKDFPNATNNLVWFFVQSKYIAWIFSVEFIWRFLKGKHLYSKLVLISIIIALSIPSTLQSFNVRRNFEKKQMVEISTDELAVYNYIRNHSSDGDVILSSTDLSTRIASLTNCRVPYANFYLSNIVSKKEILSREQDIRKFWGAWHTGFVKNDILEKYNIDFIITSKTDKYSFPNITKEINLIQTFENKNFVIFKILNQ